MTIATQPMTLEAYLNYDDGTDTRYELIEGTLIAMPTESDLNDRIASFLYAYFLQRGIHYDRLSMKTQITVKGQLANARQPDLVVLSEQTVTALEGAKQRLITDTMPPPVLVVEVVSPQQENRDYQNKRQEYAGRQIPEYWIVDPMAQKLTLLNWVNGTYAEQIYQGNQALVSGLFPDLSLTANQVLKAGRSQ